MELRRPQFPIRGILGSIAGIAIAVNSMWIHQCAQIEEVRAGSGDADLVAIGDGAIRRKEAVAVGSGALLDELTPAAIEEDSKSEEEGEEEEGEEDWDENSWREGSFGGRVAREGERGDVCREGCKSGARRRRSRRGGVEWEEGRGVCGKREFGLWRRRRRGGRRRRRVPYREEGLVEDPTVLEGNGSVG